MRIITLNYYRRHTGDCIGKHPKRSHTTQPEERKKGWRKCDCLIYASGSLDRVAGRLCTKTADWEDAMRIMAPYIAANSWEIAPYVPPSPTPTRPVESIDPPHTVANATQAFLKLHKDACSAKGTRKKHGYLMERIREFSEKQGLRFMDEWTKSVFQQFAQSDYLGNNLSPLTRKVKTGNVKAFLRYCVSMEWIDKDPTVNTVKPINNRALKTESTVARQKTPFTDAQLERMYEACRHYGKGQSSPIQRGNFHRGPNTDPRSYCRKWDGEDLMDFISLSTYTGLRISDVATFHISRINEHGEIHKRTTKNGKKVYTRVPDWLLERIQLRAKEVGPHIFGTHVTTDLDTISQGWRNRLNILWSQCGPWEHKPTPHMFRHTFARILLQNHTPPAQVAELMGDAVETVMAYYSDWVPERQQNLSRILRKSFANTPTPHSTRKAKVLEIKVG